MQAKNRVNKLNQRYELMELTGGRTRIRTGGKEITVNHDIEKLSQAWYNWLNGSFMQTAFNFLSVDEREFIMTGITTDEWNEIFAKLEEEKE